MDVQGDRAVAHFDVLRTQFDGLIDALPGILWALAIVVLGWILARLVRRATRGFADGLNRLLARVFPSGRFSGIRVTPRLSAVVGAIAFWSVLLLALTVAAQSAGLNVVASWLDRAAVHLPKVLVASAILLAGYLLSLYAREQAARLTGGRRGSAARWTQAGVMAVAIVMALDQVGVDVAVLVGVTVVAVGAVAATLGASVALGARRYTSNLMGMRSVRDQVVPGQRIRIDDISGEVLEVTRSGVTLETDEGRALVPGHLLGDRVTHVLSAAEAAERDDD